MILNRVGPGVIETIPGVSEAEYYQVQDKRDDTDIDEICRKYSQAGTVEYSAVLNRFAVTRVWTRCVACETGKGPRN